MKRYLVLALILLALAACGVDPTPTAAPPTAVPPTAVPPTAAPPMAAAPAGDSIGDTWTRPTDGAVMVYVPAGEFPMGSPPDDPDAEAMEKPQHTVSLDAFWIDQTEVTNAQYRKCVEAGACNETGCWDDDDYNAPDQPVVCVGWQDAQDYAAWVGGRLPTEAEWEKAARGTDARLYPWGNAAPDCGLANYESCVGLPSAVGSYPEGASPYQALDMAGNVREWVADWYDGDYYVESPERNPQGPEQGNLRVLRGGAFDNDASSVRSAYRFRFYPYYQYRFFGFRVVVPAGASSQQAAPAPSVAATLTAQDVQRITSTEAKALLDSDRAILYDVRSASEYNADHAAGALSFPSFEAAERLGELPAGKSLVFY